LAWLESGEDLTEVESEEGWIDAIQIMPYGKPQS
jgi:hypothetical protein